LSGPMSLYKDRDWNFPMFNNCARELRDHGYDVVNPAELGIRPGWTWNQYMRTHLKDLLDCDGLAKLPEWNYSPGALMEIQVAHVAGIEVASYGDWLWRRAVPPAGIKASTQPF
jgi:hypothetical protein